jgi:hypothetical protein
MMPDRAGHDCAVAIWLVARSAAGDGPLCAWSADILAHGGVLDVHNVEATAR